MALIAISDADIDIAAYSLTRNAGRSIAAIASEMTSTKLLSTYDNKSLVRLTCQPSEESETRDAFEAMDYQVIAERYLPTLKSYCRQVRYQQFNCFIEDHDPINPPMGKSTLTICVPLVLDDIISHYHRCRSIGIATCQPPRSFNRISRSTLVPSVRASRGSSVTETREFVLRSIAHRLPFDGNIKKTKGGTGVFFSPNLLLAEGWSNNYTIKHHGGVSRDSFCTFGRAAWNINKYLEFKINRVCNWTKADSQTAGSVPGLCRHHP